LPPVPPPQAERVWPRSGRAAREAAKAREGNFMGPSLGAGGAGRAPLRHAHARTRIPR
jgi:hypothetical protein